MPNRSVRLIGLFSLALVVVLTSASAQLLDRSGDGPSTSPTNPATGMRTTFALDGEQVRIFRNPFGVPQIFADTKS